MRGAVAAGLAVLALGCGRGDSRIPEILGEVNNEYLTTDEFLHQLKARGGAHLQGAARADFNRWLLAEIVDRKLLVQEARRRGVKPSREDVRERIMEMGARGWEDAERVSFMNVEDDLYDQRQIEELLRREIPPVRTPGTREVRRFVNAHRGLFRRPDQVRLRQIVVHSAAMVESAKRMIEAGTSFEETARRVAGTPRAAAMGPAWVAQEDVPGEVWEAARAAARGSLGGPVASEYGFHLFRVEDRRPAGLISSEEAEARARKRLIEERRHGAVQEFLARLRRSAVIRVDLESVARL